MIIPCRIYDRSGRDSSMRIRISRPDQLTISPSENATQTLRRACYDESCAMHGKFRRSSLVSLWPFIRCREETRHNAPAAGLVYTSVDAHSMACTGSLLEIGLSPALCACECVYARCWTKARKKYPHNNGDHLQCPVQHMSSQTRAG